MNRELEKKIRKLCRAILAYADRRALPFELLPHHKAVREILDELDRGEPADQRTVPQHVIFRVSDD